MRSLPSLTPMQVARFWMQIQEVHRGFQIKGAPSACLEWTGDCDDHGYGRYLRGKYRTHRLAIVLLGGSDPGNSGVFHRCDNPPCVRDSHLFLGTQAENLADMARKGRGVKSQFAPSTMREIQRLYASGQHTYTNLGHLYGVSPSHIGLIVRNQLKTLEKT